MSSSIKPFVVTGPGIGKGTPGPGRPKGMKTKKHNRRYDIAIKILNGPITPLEIMFQMATGERKFNAEILEACKACAPYVHPRLVAMQLEVSDVRSHEQMLDDMDRLDKEHPELGISSSSLEDLECIGEVAHEEDLSQEDYEGVLNELDSEPEPD